MVTSIPEKTLEHWISIYLTYRYKSYAGLWWPAFGEDIKVSHLPSHPGKLTLLEVKTANSSKSKPALHVVSVNKQQLAKYLAKPLYAQPFYVIVSPHWQGKFTDWCYKNNLDPTESAFRRALHTQQGWFANWLMVLTALEVDRIINSSNKPNSATTATLLRVDTSANSRTLTWGNGSSKAPKRYTFREFCNRLESCGDATWGQIINLPPGTTPSSITYSREAMNGFIEERKATKGQRADVETTKVLRWGWNRERYVPLESESVLLSADDYEDNSITGLYLGIDALNPHLR